MIYALKEYKINTNMSKINNKGVTIEIKRVRFKRVHMYIKIRK